MSRTDYFNRVAPEWDRIRATLFSEAVRQKALAVAQVKPGMLAADLGAGTGFITEGLVRKGVRVIAVDQSQAMLVELRQKFGPEAGVDCRLGVDRELPIDDNSVDFVFANMFLHHVESPAIAIQEMVRILMPEGRLVITDMDEHGFEFLREEQNDRWLGFKRDDVRNWLTSAGLKDVAVDGLDEVCCARSRGRGEVAEVSLFVAWGVK